MTHADTRSPTEEIATWPIWQSGDRVEVPEDVVGLTLSSTTGTVLGPDPFWDGYYRIRLDQPAYDCDNGSEVWEIREAGDNIRATG